MPPRRPRSAASACWAHLLLWSSTVATPSAAGASASMRWRGWTRAALATSPCRARCARTVARRLLLALLPTRGTASPPACWSRTWSPPRSGGWSRRRCGRRACGWRTAPAAMSPWTWVRSGRSMMHQALPGRVAVACRRWCSARSRAATSGSASSASGRPTRVAPALPAHLPHQLHPRQLQAAAFPRQLRVLLAPLPQQAQHQRPPPGRLSTRCLLRLSRSWATGRAPAAQWSRRRRAATT